ncbi:gamma-glutamyltransferase [Glaciecola petra]|uniref:Glutathione hydrolase proenzyme n=1 Tax=Glaciecola petra TaxID=3075602 RepID=A0ABU2ZQP1_9ALTE|nr:gamma-glutamyltransferase [Aestuariibacter sp. P117]MDT0594353.1 gamma-glutamyltransferase [Aestuariibacter sp. P117]
MNFKKMPMVVAIIISALLGACSSNEEKVVLEDREPEAATGVQNKQLVSSQHYMVAAANPYAVRAGQTVIENGGTAIDAAVAVQAMLTLVEPQSSGIGGGAFIMYWDNANKTLHTFDGRETAPASIDENVFIQDGKAMAWRQAVVGGKSVGVPGSLKALEMAQAAFGKLSWDSLFDESISQAENGFVVSPRLARLVEIDVHPGLNLFPESMAYFKPDGKAIKAGDIKKNKALAETFRLIAKGGSDVFYKGQIAKNISDTVNTAAVNPGTISATDFAHYEAIERAPMCNKYRQYKICGMAPPSSGGVSVFQILKVLEQFDLSQYGPQSAEFVHLFTQASAMAFADRAEYIADLSYLELSAEPLINQDYLAERAKLVGVKQPFSTKTAGQPYPMLVTTTDNAYELDSTSHISIVDKQGNAVSMTSSIEFMFGSGLMVDGFLLNNQLTDFSLNPNKDGKPVLNRAQANKRPRSAMSPSIVFDDKGELILVVGSPGGSRIINYVAQTIVNVLDFDMDIQTAIDAPRVSNRNGSTALEKGTNIVKLESKLSDLGHKVRIVDLNSGLHGVQIKDGVLKGGADPRREGIALGQ